MNIKRMVIGGIAVLALVVAAIFARVALASRTTPLTWITYQEPHGLLTASIPSGWTADEQVEAVTNGTMLAPAQSYTDTLYAVTWHSPAATGMSIFVSIILYNQSPSEHAFDCQGQQSQHATTTVDGVPATYSYAGHNALGLYIIQTTAAGYQIQYRPGDQGSAAAAIYQQVIATLVLSPAQPLVCP